MIFVIIIAHAAQKSQHNFRFFRPAAADERLLLTRELSAKLTEGEKTLDFCIALKKCKPSGLLSLRQNLRFCHLPRQREALDPRIPKASPMRGSWLRSEAAQTDEVDCVTQTEAPHLIRHGYRRATFPS